MNITYWYYYLLDMHNIIYLNVKSSDILCPPHIYTHSRTHTRHEHTEEPARVCGMRMGGSCGKQGNEIETYPSCKVCGCDEKSQRNGENRYRLLWRLYVGDEYIGLIKHVPQNRRVVKIAVAFIYDLSRETTDPVFIDWKFTIIFFSLCSFIILVIAGFDDFIGRRLICTNVTHYYLICWTLRWTLHA